MVLALPPGALHSVGMQKSQNQYSYYLDIITHVRDATNPWEQSCALAWVGGTSFLSHVVLESSKKKYVSFSFIKKIKEELV